MLVEKWRFAPSMIDTIGNQFGPELKDTGMIACVFAANQITKRLNFGFPGNPFVPELPPAIALRLGGSPDDVVLSLGDLALLLEEAKLFSNI